MIVPNIWEKKNVPNHQPGFYVVLCSIIRTISFLLVRWCKPPQFAASKLWLSRSRQRTNQDVELPRVVGVHRLGDPQWTAWLLQSKWLKNLDDLGCPPLDWTPPNGVDFFWGGNTSKSQMSSIFAINIATVLSKSDLISQSTSVLGGSSHRSQVGYSL